MAAASDRVGIVGAGLIGRAWAIVFARAGWRAALYDAVPGVAAGALGTIRDRLMDLRRYELIDEAPDAVLARIAPVDTLAATLDGAALVQENVAEKVEVKRELFAELDRLAAPQTVLASSTSSISASQFSERLAGRGRCLVAHPVNPPYLIPLVEIAPAPWTDPAVTARAREFYAVVKQSPIIVKREIDGFILNRLQGALLAEAFRLFEDDYVSAADLDLTLSDGLGLRWSFMGPFETIDLNAPGGIRDYVERYGLMYRAMAEQARPRHWRGEVVDRVERERRQVLPADELARRQAWRDQQLMALLAHKKRMSGEQPRRDAT